jgi:hypothetical protein
MKILVRAVNLELDGKVREEVEARLRVGLDRLAHRIQRVTVRVVDQNGPRGGMDITCLVDVRLRPRGRLFIQETDLTPLGAVSRAGDAAATAVTRRFERSRDLHRRGSLRRLAEASNGNRPASESFA